MIHQFKVHIMTINGDIIERLINCVDSSSAIFISNTTYGGRVIDTEMIF